MTVEQLILIGSSAGLIMALVQIIKPFIKDTRLNPVLALLIGVGLSLTVQWAIGAMHRLDVVTSIIQGLLSGVGASGLYSFGSAMNQPKPPVPPTPPS